MGQIADERSASQGNALRYFVSGWALDVHGKSIWVQDIVTVARPLDSGAASGFIVAKARHFGRIIADDATIHVSNLFALRPIPRPPENEPRPLRFWQVTVDFVCHDVKYAGIAEGIFAWPEEPKGGTLSPMVGLLIGDALADRGGPDGENYSDVRSVKVVSSTDPPTTYA